MAYMLNPLPVRTALYAFRLARGRAVAQLHPEQRAEIRSDPILIAALEAARKRRGR